MGKRKGISNSLGAIKRNAGLVILRNWEIAWRGKRESQRAW